MCGIVGYIGKKDAAPILLEGLKKLEYRGYDSAGIAVQETQGIALVKKKGKLNSLEEILKQKSPRGNVGIGHTRWATHGKPSTPNSHPHQSSEGEFVVVHNGIIENYLELKNQLKKEGYIFDSETDTEVIPNLISKFYQGNIEEAVRKAVALLEGSYAIAVLSKKEKEKIVAVRKDSPLIIGLGEDEYFIGSDIPAILDHTRSVYILDDNEMAVLEHQGVKTYTVEGEELDKEVFNVDWEASMAEKGGYDHFMLKEIHEQPETVKKCINGRLTATDVQFDSFNMEQEELNEYNKIYIVACGTAYNSGLVGKYAIEKLARIPVEVAIASEFRYRDPIVDENTLVIVVSQSGETADTLAAVRESKAKGARIIGICNVVGSTIARESDDVIYIHAGPEIAVASTKAYIGMITVQYLLAIYFARIKGLLKDDKSREIISSFRRIPEQIKEVIEKNEAEIKAQIGNYAERENIFYIGRGLDNAVVEEASLKLKEISYIHAESYPAGELKHGTLALVEEGVPVIAVATQPDVIDKTLSNIKEVKARDGVVTAVVTEGEKDLDDIDYRFEIPATNDLLTGILSTVPLQLLAYYVAVERECAIDQPRNLAKSVTVE
ncbi:glutamine--fructose-6-phosphate transaminase [Halanaerobium saccharolyticum]|jgi:glucosamine--fructose-6-phosphate aminotransferase (isomerizing)|uniref:Glutamine--fructose-6-phosphate aminotransferase [isomerizing] n=1 Tax=Halanaerobium saccharolyticum TaxID=43595 RepID=A0A4R6LLN8_9FIRM|nr:glutamine--fructose-6-phosphate transaminase (isomerizing) [Halanaerobium saccharolyticum]TDO86094.1 glutamine--fructose-6-phosphate transaminase [Halanaerobium saccharolyticum]